MQSDVRGRKPKPGALHVLDGTYRADRHGPLLFPIHGKAPGSIPEPPKHLTGTALRVWKRTVEDLGGLGILDQADRGILALYCEACAELSWASYKIAKEGRIVPTGLGGQKPHPAVGIKNAAALRAGKFAAELGLTPTARARLRLGAGFGPDDPDPEESDLD